MAESLRFFLIMDFSRGNQHPFILRLFSEYGAMVLVLFKYKVSCCAEYRFHRGERLRDELWHLSHGSSSNKYGKVIRA